MQTQGTFKFRKTFPQLPGGTVENPTYIQTEHGNRLLTSGWWAYARKPVRSFLPFLYKNVVFIHQTKILK